MSPPLKWNQVGDRVASWHRYVVDAGHEPDKVIGWAQDNLAGAWTFRNLNDAEVQREFGRPPSGRFFMEFRTAESSDAERLQLKFGAAAGSG